MTEGRSSYSTLEFTQEFLEDLTRRGFSAAELSRVYRILRLLDSNERHPSLRVHQLEGDMRGSWSASVTDEIRITFERLGDGKKRLISLSRHYRR